MSIELVITGIAIPILITIFGWLWKLKGSTARNSADIESVKEDVERIGKDIKGVECLNSNLETKIRLFIDERDRSMLLKFDRTDAKIDDLKNALNGIAISLMEIKTNNANSNVNIGRLADLLDKADDENNEMKQKLIQLETEVKLTRSA